MTIALLQIDKTAMLGESKVMSAHKVQLLMIACPACHHVMIVGVTVLLTRRDSAQAA